MKYLRESAVIEYGFWHGFLTSIFAIFCIVWVIYMNYGSIVVFLDSIGEHVCGPLVVPKSVEIACDSVDYELVVVPEYIVHSDA